MPNMKAFLDVISISEGTFGRGDNGYNVLVGGGLFSGYADHPRILVPLPRLGISSTAAGRYQLLARYFDVYKRQLNLPDFSPASQDDIAIKQIKESGAEQAITDGRFQSAVMACRHIWASLPGAGYGQHENSLADLQAAFVRQGGVLAPDTAEA